MTPRVPVPHVPVAAARMLVRLALNPALSPSLPVGVQRLWLELAARAIPLPPGVRTTAVDLRGVPGRRVEHESADASCVVLYLHGGGFVTGSSRTHLGLAAHLSRACGVPVCLPDYRRAPEHPYPAALDDTVSAYRALVDSGYEPDRIVFAGDSAGGCLAVAAAVRLRDAGEPLPAALAVISPMTDMTLVGAAMAPGARRPPLMSEAWLRDCVRRYAGPHARAQPELSPVHADLARLPPLAIQAGADDVLVNDSDRLARKARAAGVAVTYQRFDGLWHEFQNLAGVLREADAALEDLGTWIRQQLRQRQGTTV